MTSSEQADIIELVYKHKYNLSPHADVLCRVVLAKYMRYKEWRLFSSVLQIGFILGLYYTMRWICVSRKNINKFEKQEYLSLFTLRSCAPVSFSTRKSHFLLRTMFLPHCNARFITTAEARGRAYPILNFHWFVLLND